MSMLEFREGEKYKQLKPVYGTSSVQVHGVRNQKGTGDSLGKKEHRTNKTNKTHRINKIMKNSRGNPLVNQLSNLEKAYKFNQYLDTKTRSRVRSKNFSQHIRPKEINPYKGWLHDFLFNLNAMYANHTFKFVIGVTIFFIVTLLGISYTQTYFKIKNNGEILKAEIKKFPDLVESRDSESIIDTLDEIMNVTKDTKKEYSKVKPLKIIPGASGYINEVDQILASSDSFEQVYNEEKDNIKNILDMHFKNEEVPDEEKDYTYINDLITLLDEHFYVFLEAYKNIVEVDENFIPSDSAKEALKLIKDLDIKPTQIEKLYNEFQEEFTLLPTLLGIDEPMNLLLLFQNDNEMRSTGGLITAYSYVTIEGGQITNDIESKDIYALDSDIMDDYRISSVPIPENIGYFMVPCGQPYWFFRESNTSIDLDVSADNLDSFYSREILLLGEEETIEEQEEKGRIILPEIDGYLLIDTNFVEKLLGAIGGVTLEETGDIVTEENFIDFIIDKKETVRTQLKDQRAGESKEIIGKIGSEILDTVMNEFPKYGDKVLLTLIDSLKSKHVQVHFYDEGLDSAANYYKVDGEIERNASKYTDYLNIGESNLCALKMNLWVEDVTDYSINFLQDGSAEVTVKTTWTNNASYENKEDFPLLLGPAYTAWIQKMLPEEAEILDYDIGGEKGTVTTPEYNLNENLVEKLNKTTIDQYINISTKQNNYDPATSAYSQFTYRLPQADIENYRLLLQKHPGKKTQKVNIQAKRNGMQLSQIETLLEVDKLIKFDGQSLDIQDYNQEIESVYDLYEIYIKVKETTLE